MLRRDMAVTWRFPEHRKPYTTLNLTTQILRHQILHSAHWSSGLDLLDMLPPCLDMCACTCRTCQLRLGTRFTLTLSPSVCRSPATLSGLVVSGLRRGGVPHRLIGLCLHCLGSSLRRFSNRLTGFLCHAAGAASFPHVLFMWLVCWAVVEAVVVPPIRWGPLSRMRQCCFPRHCLGLSAFFCTSLNLPPVFGLWCSRSVRSLTEDSSALPPPVCSDLLTYFPGCL